MYTLHTTHIFWEANNNQNRTNNEVLCETLAAIGWLKFYFWSFWSCLIQLKLNYTSNYAKWMRLPHISFSWVNLMLDHYFLSAFRRTTKAEATLTFFVPYNTIFEVTGLFFLPSNVHDCITNQMRCLCNRPKSFIWFSIVLQIKITWMRIKNISQWLQRNSQLAHLWHFACVCVFLFFFVLYHSQTPISCWMRFLFSFFCRFHGCGWLHTWMGFVFL